MSARDAERRPGGGGALDGGEHVTTTVTHRADTVPVPEVDALVAGVMTAALERAGGVYRPSAVKRTRSTKAEMAAFRGALVEIIEDNGPPLTCRQVHYRAASVGLYAKEERNYRRTIDALSKMRETGEIPWSWVADNTRWVRQQTTHTDADEFLDEMQSMYRRDLWRTQPYRVEVWVESDSIAGFLGDEVIDLGVPLYVCRGQSSKAYIHGAATDSAALGKPVRVLYVGDFDPTGLRITESVGDRYRRYAPGADLQIRRIAVTAEQIEVYGLLPHATKTTDPNYRWYADRCADLGTPHYADAHGRPVPASFETEAIPPRVLRRIVADEVMDFIDPETWRLQQAVEETEREQLADFIGGWFA